MSFDIVIFGGAAAARNGLTTTAPNGGEDLYKIDGSGNYLVNNSGKDKYILAAQCLSAGIANIANWQFHLTDENEWTTITTSWARDQTGAFVTEAPMRLSKVWPKGKMLQVQIDNANNSQVDQVVFFVADSPSEMIDFGQYAKLPAGYQWYKFTGATTVTAAVMSDVALTAVNFYPEDGIVNHIAGMAGVAATGLLARLRHKAGGTQGVRPGAFIGDIAAPAVSMPTFGDFGKFVGDNYPVVQHDSVAADTAEIYYLLIKRGS